MNEKREVTTARICARIRGIINPTEDVLALNLSQVDRFASAEHLRWHKL